MRIPSTKGTLRIYGRYYVVQYGDSMYSIAQKFNVTVANLLAFNDQVDQTALIYAGEVLFIPNKHALEQKQNKSKRRK